MSLKVVLFSFHGVVINDETIHQKLIDEILLQENLRPSTLDYQQLCMGKSDRACLGEILARRGRVVTPAYLNQLVQQQSGSYRAAASQWDCLPLYEHLETFLQQLESQSILRGIVAGAQQQDIEYVLQRAGLNPYFNLVVGERESLNSKPAPDSYIYALERLQAEYPQQQIQSHNCLAIENTPNGITAAQRAGMQVVGIANTYPLHMLQRQANWVVDNFTEIELDRVTRVLAHS